MVEKTLFQIGLTEAQVDEMRSAHARQLNRDVGKMILSHFALETLKSKYPHRRTEIDYSRFKTAQKSHFLYPYRMALDEFVADLYETLDGSLGHPSLSIIQFLEHARRDISALIRT